MAKCYFEFRKSAARGTDSAAADIMRHLHARQHLGKAVVVCERPAIMLPTARKQWMKLSRWAQRQRASTLSADKILKYTHTIIHMQNMRFSRQTPLEEPEADIYFVTPERLAAAPLHCFSTYLAAPLATQAATEFVSQLPADALIVDYVHTLNWAHLGLQAKSVLEQQVRTEWRQLSHFLHAQQIEITALHSGNLHHVEAMDDALDTLLGKPHEFLRIATEFRHALELARPLRLSQLQRHHYDALMLLAHRVQTLSTTTFNQHFLENYNEDDTFFLYDIAHKRFATTGESLSECLARHARLGHGHIVRALQRIA